MRITVTILLYALVLFLTWYSSSIYITLMVAIWIIAITILATLVSSIFFHGSFREKIANAAKITFPVAAIVFILGYFYETVKPML